MAPPPSAGKPGGGAVNRIGFGLPGFEQAVGEVSAGGDEECTGAHRDVGDLQLEQLGGGLEFPLGGVWLLGGAGVVGDWVERVADDLLGELTWRVVGARCATIERLGDE